MRCFCTTLVSRALNCKPNDESQRQPLVKHLCDAETGSGDIMGRLGDA